MPRFDALLTERRSHKSAYIHAFDEEEKNLVRAALEGEGCVFLRRSLEGLSTARVNRGLEKSEKESPFEFFNFQPRGSLPFRVMVVSISKDGTSGNEHQISCRFFHSTRFQIVWILNKYKI